MNIKNGHSYGIYEKELHINPTIAIVGYIMNFPMGNIEKKISNLMFLEKMP